MLIGALIGLAIFSTIIFMSNPTRRNSTRENQERAAWIRIASMAVFFPSMGAAIGIFITHFLA